MNRNPLQWPSFEQLGRDFCESITLALDKLEGGEEVTGKAENQLRRLQAWLDAPCVAAVKLDGTNVGIDENGLIVGRNCVVTAGETYQKVDVWSLLKGYDQKVAQLKSEIQKSASGEALQQVMAYGELLINNKFDYGDVGLLHKWLCFGLVLRPVGDPEEASERLAAALRAGGFNAARRGDCVLIALSEQLARLLADVGLPSVASSGYVPRGAGTPDDWAQHDGSDQLPVFTSMRGLITSNWARNVLLPASGQPLAEGLVVASMHDGRLFKWKNAAEELGKVPQMLETVVDRLQKLRGRAGELEELLPAFEVLLLVATTKPLLPAPVQKAAKGKAKAAADPEAAAAFESTLTKFDSLEEVFARGDEAKKEYTEAIIEQVIKDLIKDYGVEKEAAQRRAQQLVRREVDARHSAWQQARSP